MTTLRLSAQVTIPQIQYQDLGLTLKATPWVQHGTEVSLKMDLEFTALPLQDGDERLTVVLAIGVGRLEQTEAGEGRGHAPEVVALPGGEGMVVALGAAQRHAEELLADGPG